MFQTQQIVCPLNNAREVYNTDLEKEKGLGLDETDQTESVCRLTEDTHDTVEGTETVQCNYVKTKCGPKVYSKVFHSSYSL